MDKFDFTLKQKTESLSFFHGVKETFLLVHSHQIKTLIIVFRGIRISHDQFCAHIPLADPINEHMDNTLDLRTFGCF